MQRDAVQKSDVAKNRKPRNTISGCQLTVFIIARYHDVISRFHVVISRFRVLISRFTW